MRISWLVLLGLGLALTALALSAEAKSTGPCTATINGEDLATTDKIELEQGDVATYTFNAQAPVRAWSADLSYGPYSQAVDEGTSDSEETSKSGQVDTAEFAGLGVGLYTVKGTAILEGGEQCTAEVDLLLKGNPLATAVGLTSAGLAVGGTAGAAAPVLKAVLLAAKGV